MIPEEDKYFLLKFPKAPKHHVQPPIPPDLEDDDDDSSIVKLPTAASNASEDLFKLG